MPELPFEKHAWICLADWCSA